MSGFCDGGGALLLVQEMEFSTATTRFSTEGGLSAFHHTNTAATSNQREGTGSWRETVDAFVPSGGARRPQNHSAAIFSMCSLSSLNCSAEIKHISSLSPKCC